MKDSKIRIGSSEIFKHNFFCCNIRNILSTILSTYRVHNKRDTKNEIGALLRGASTSKPRRSFNRGSASMADCLRCHCFLLLVLSLSASSSHCEPQSKWTEFAKTKPDPAQIRQWTRDSPRKRVTLMIDLDFTALYGNDGNDLGLALQWMDKDPSVVQELYSKLINPELQTMYQSYVARSREVKVVIYTRRPQVRCIGWLTSGYYTGAAAERSHSPLSALSSTPIPSLIKFSTVSRSFITVTSSASRPCPCAMTTTGMLKASSSSHPLCAPPAT
jgi:hypothetical protein